MSIKINNVNLRDVMLPVSQIPVHRRSTIFKEVLEDMCIKNLGIACIVDADMKLVGVITDGDLRRRLLRVQKPLSATLIEDVGNILNNEPVVIELSTQIIDAVNVMGDHRILDLPIVDKRGVLCGLLHLHSVVSSLMNMSDYNVK